MFVHIVSVALVFCRLILDLLSHVRVKNPRRISHEVLLCLFDCSPRFEKFAEQTAAAPACEKITYLFFFWIFYCLSITHLLHMHRTNTVDMNTIA